MRISESFNLIDLKQYPLSFNRESRRLYLTKLFEDKVKDTLPDLIYVIDDNKIFPDKNALYQCMLNIVSKHPTYSSIYDVYWKKGLSRVSIFKKE